MRLLALYEKVQDLAGEVILTLTAFPPPSGSSPSADSSPADDPARAQTTTVHFLSVTTFRPFRLPVSHEGAWGLDTRLTCTEMQLISASEEIKHLQSDQEFV